MSDHTAWRRPTRSQIDACQAARRKALWEHTARELLVEAEAALAGCTDTPAAQLRARIALFLATT